MFASDRAIAEAIVGKEAAPDWIKNRLPTLKTNAGSRRSTRSTAEDQFHSVRLLRELPSSAQRAGDGELAAW